MSTNAEVNALKEQRAGLFQQMRDLNVKAESEERDLTAEEAQEFDRMEQEAETLERRAGRMEKLLGMDSGFRRETDGGDGGDDGGDEGDEPAPPASFTEYRERRAGIRPQDVAEYRSVFYKAFSESGPLTADEHRVLSKASAGAGLNLVPTDFARELVDSLRDFGVMRQISNIITTDSGEALQVPSVTSHGTASWTAENAAYTASDEVFGQATLNAYKAATLIKVSEELLTDSAFDLQAYIRREFGERIGVLENTAYVTGDGTGKPTGITTQTSAGATGATGTTTTVTPDSLVDLYHSILPGYRRNAVWVMNDSSIKAVRKIKTGISGDVSYVWQPGLTAGAPDLLLGKPVFADPDVAAMAANAKSILFGDFSYYWIRDVNGITFQRLNELYAENGQVGFRANHRTDGRLMNTAAVKHYANSAT